MVNLYDIMYVCLYASVPPYIKAFTSTNIKAVYYITYIKCTCRTTIPQSYLSCISTTHYIRL